MSGGWKKWTRLFVPILLVIFLSGCGLTGIKIVGEESEAFASYKASYIIAAEEFDKSFEKYLNTFDMMPPEIQERWIEEIDPLFLKGADLLDKWEVHVLSGSFIPSSQDDYLALKDQLFYMLMREKLRETK